MKGFILLLSLFLLAIGFFYNLDNIATIGSTVFLLSQGFYLYEAYVYSKMYKKDPDGTIQEMNRTNKIDRFYKYIEGAIVLYSIIVMIIGRQMVSGVIIWVGSIFVYFIAGVIIEMITDIPLRFGYGGWQIRRNRRIK